MQVYGELVRSRGPGWLAAIVAGAAVLALLGPVSAQAAPPPVTGDVACSFQGNIAFDPPLNYQQGRFGRRTPPIDRDAKVTLSGTLSGCTGTQTGGPPKKQPPLAHAEVLARGTMVDHGCRTLSLHGVALSKVRIRWFNAGGTRVGVTKGSAGSITVSGLGDGVPSTWTGPPSPVFPPTVPPGNIDFAGSLGSNANAKVFPGEPASVAFRANRTVDSFVFPCSYATPPLSMGIPNFSFAGGDFTVS
jgi:hypothetical protein